MKSKINKYDISLIVGVMIVNVLIIIIGSKNVVHSDANKAIIYSNNELFGQYYLEDDYEDSIVVDSGRGGTNTINIRNGEIWIEDATCPDKLCIHQGHIKNDGEIIVCIPNQMIIKIEGKEDNNEIDL